MTEPVPEHDPKLWEALSTVLDPEVRRPITDLGMVQSATLDASGTATVQLLLTIAACPAATRITERTRAAIERVPEVTEAVLDVGVMSAEQRREFRDRVRGSAPRGIPFTPDGLTRVIAVTSGKGGVGKSTLTVQLAVQLAQRGYAVGLVDADVFGFSIPALMGLSRDGRAVQPSRVDDLILPPEAHGVNVISIGMFLQEDARSTAVSWRGPMLHRTIEQFLRDVWFGDLDVLLLDLPPGTGDIAISVGQLLPHAEVIVVTTPQVSAADVAVRSGIVALQSGQRLLGVVENMSGLTTPDGATVELFGSGGGAAVAERLSAHAAAHHPPGSPVPVLGSIPLSIPLREAGDAGDPRDPRLDDDPAVAAIGAIAARIMQPGRGLPGKQLPLTPL